MAIIDLDTLTAVARRMSYAAEQLGTDAERLRRAAAGLDWSSDVSSAVRDLLLDTSGRVITRAEELVGIAVEMRRQAADLHVLAQTTGRLATAAESGARDVGMAALAIGKVAL